MPSNKSSRLVVVESPTKAKTIRAFLPSGYRVAASMGHVRDLPESAAEIPAAFKGKEWARLGVNVHDDFQPLYVVPGSKKKVVGELRELLRDASELILATDEDREGESEAIRARCPPWCSSSSWPLHSMPKASISALDRAWYFFSSP